MPGCLSNRQAIFFALSHECVLMSRLMYVLSGMGEGLKH